MRRTSYTTSANIAKQARELLSDDSKVAILHSAETSWVCIVGQEFRMHCSHIAKTFMFFYVGKVAICVYQTEYWVKTDDERTTGRA